MWSDANRAWFEFDLVEESISGSEDLLVYAFTGKEGVNRPYEFIIELVSRNSELDLNAFVGKVAVLRITDRSGEQRLVHGIIRTMDQLHTTDGHTHYRAKLVPRLWFLQKRENHRIYQRQTVIEIIRSLLYEQGFPAETFSFENCGYTSDPRAYCVQYV